MTRFDATGVPLAVGRGVAARAQVRWRLDGVGRKATFSGHDSDARAAELLGLLAAAHAGNWDADENHRPVPPATLDVRAVKPPTAPAPRPLPTVPAAAGAPKDISELVEFGHGRTGTHRKRRGGDKLSGKTLESYESSLRIIDRVGRYRTGDPRLDDDVEVGDPIRLGDLCPGDLVDMISPASGSRRCTTNSSPGF